MTATAYEVALTAEEPLRVGGGTIGQVVTAHDHVPGSVLRGALAARWIAEHGLPDSVEDPLAEQFRALFEGHIRYGPLLPHGSDLEPLAVARCRYQPTADCHDVLIDAAHVDEEPTYCTTCHGPLIAGKGALRDCPAPIDGMHAPLNASETAQEGALHSREYLPAGTVLRGRIIGDHPWLAAAPQRVWVGGKRSVGGLARLELAEAAVVQPAQRPDGRLHIELVAPGVFVDDAGRALTGFPLHEIARILDCTPPRIVKSWTRLTQTGGWHAATRLPKPVDHAVAPGSAVLLDLPDGAPTDDELLRLTARGLGLRRSEGFGWINVNPPPRRPHPLPPADDSGEQPHPALAAADAVDARDLAALIPALRDFAIARMHHREHPGPLPIQPHTLHHATASALDDLAALAPHHLEDVLVLLEDALEDRQERTTP